MKRAIISSDDFGLSVEVNEAIEIAHREGVLSTASLMVAGPAAADAVERAKRLPGLHVGLHLVVIEGASVLPHTSLPLITQPDGWFSSSQLGLGVDYFFRPQGRKQLHKEITAQFEAFRKTGLTLDHANAHKHMHLHPTVARMMIDIGKNYGLRAIRTPLEPPAPLAASEKISDSFGDAVLRQWTRLLRHQIRSAGMVTNDWCFGLAWSGHMTAQRVSALATHLPDGISEIYFHPATHKNALIQKLMPAYEHEAEFEALCASSFKDSLRTGHVTPCTWQDI
ncbi:hopanoid biosynthesis-associated protein HpnK [Acetobacter thailandicus]|uniref:Hopanoid biosynthesis-associated protein HpnK n=1 Tax=Acetobacter thailandicus TaxID=1502842 RepID=A0ABT3QGZ0_9PROT|nr:hopanoid biosynthesis-associated protein HpnK [Acetobacter thailandicus]MCX2564556.1 hopanoid biosynthesis-associated protein HpnK [Acetobacter thailandicus]NHN95979.1 hopanoid biosynthesis-associated protein HpnK [Acetobacter thailandicus]